MDYQISEDEFNSIASCADQIDLLTGLCAYIPKGHQAITIAGLDSFLSAQNKMLRATLKGLEERQKARQALNQSAIATALHKSTSLPISAALLVRIMEVCSGGVRDEKAVVELHDELYDATVLHGEAEPLSALYSALYRQGFDISSTTRNGVSTFTIKHARPKKATQSPEPIKTPARKRERLTATT